LAKEKIMTSHFCKALLHFFFFVLLPVLALAQKPAPARPAPIPSQILAAKKIFIANAGGDEMTRQDAIFTGGPARAYNQFYAAMKTWGRFEIVGSPAEADLLFEVRQETFTVAPPSKTGSPYHPEFRLTIRDPKNDALLWGFDVHSEFATWQGASDRNFDLAVDQLVTDVQGLVGMTPNAASVTNR
jgi:hypothetical protein